MQPGVYVTERKGLKQSPWLKAPIYEVYFESKIGERRAYRVESLGYIPKTRAL
jgi:hypothetical protein